MSNKRIGGVVIIYNPLRDIPDNINSYLAQVDELIIFDNTPKKPDWLSDFVNTNNKIKYVGFQKNMGVSYALNYAAKYFSESGFDYLLTMDQDSIVPQDMVQKLLKVIEKDESIGIVTPIHGNKYNTNAVQENKLQKLSVAKTSGNLLSLAAFQKTGVFNEDLFIDYVDIEYCMRLNITGYKVIQCNSVILEHNEANISEKRFFFKTVYPYNHSPIRLYYKTRNRFYLMDSYKDTFPEYFEIERKSFINNIIKVVLYENKKILKLKLSLIGYYHYLKGIKGRAPFNHG